MGKAKEECKYQLFQEHDKYPITAAQDYTEQEEKEDRPKNFGNFKYEY
jgi:hypothetical protein